jgi:hypothetical protein
VKLRIRYHRLEDLARAGQEQLAHGGVLVQVDPPPGLELFAPVTLTIAWPDGQISVEAQVVQMKQGAGIAVAFTVPPELTAAASRAGAAPPDPNGPPPEHGTGDEPAARESPRRPTHAEKIQQALHGNKDQRLEILRDQNRGLHPYVLKNPQLGIDEVAWIAKMTTVAPDVLKAICLRPEWVRRPEVAINLVRNPKIAVPDAIRLLEYVSPADLRQLAKDNRTREPVARAARKRVVG